MYRPQDMQSSTTGGGTLGAEGMIDTADAAVTPAGVTYSGRPSLWSAVWAAVALLWLIIGRRSFGRMGR